MRKCAPDKTLRKRPTSCDNGSERNTDIRTLKDIVKDYKVNYRPGEQGELSYYKHQKSLKKAIEKAAMAKLSDGSKHPHQWRRKSETLEEAKDRLLRASLRGCKSFSELHDKVEKVIGNINDIGALTVYDTAHRIGAYLGIEPQEVYMHTGTREGAKALDVDYKAKTLPKGIFPKELRTLKPYEIEDCLCIYKEYLWKVT